MGKEHSVSIRQMRRVSDVKPSGWIVEHFIDNMYAGSISPSTEREKAFFTLLDNHGLTDEYFTLLVKEQGTLKGWPGAFPIREWVTAHFLWTTNNEDEWSCIHDEWLKLNPSSEEFTEKFVDSSQFSKGVIYSPVLDTAPCMRLFDYDGNPVFFSDLDRDSNGEEDSPTAENEEVTGCNAEEKTLAWPTASEMAESMKKVARCTPSFKDLYPDEDHAVAREDAYIKARSPEDNMKKASAMSATFGNRPWFTAHMSEFQAENAKRLEELEAMAKLRRGKSELWAASCNTDDKINGRGFDSIIIDDPLNELYDRDSNGEEDPALARCGVDVKELMPDRERVYGAEDLTPDMMSEEFREMYTVNDSLHIATMWKFLAKLVPCVFGAIAGTMIIAVICAVVISGILWFLSTWTQGSLIVLSIVGICYSLYRVFLCLWGKG